MRLLAIDTSTEACSAALLLPDGQVLLRLTITERSHADLILPMIDSVLAEAEFRLADLDGLAFGRGPGGFTGLRIAAGVIQGLAFGAGLKVVPVSSLAAVAYAVSGTCAGEGVLVCNDARMKELYWSCYRFDPADPCAPIALSEERVGPPDSIIAADGARHFPDGVGHFAGNGIPPYRDLQDRLEAAGLCFHPGVHPRADAIARIGAVMLERGQAVDAVDAQPVYVRDNVARPAGPAVTGMS
jgi:tRNA threonylcarbamoyladenosine biosynthesis protein TsaB